jgi:formyltetrahydrofolate hydrolase
MRNSAILLVQCPDRKGLDATIAEFIYRYDGNILRFEQHQAGDDRYYLARVEWALDGFRLNLNDFDGAFGPIAQAGVCGGEAAPAGAQSRSEVDRSDGALCDGSSG